MNTDGNPPRIATPEEHRLALRKWLHEKRLGSMDGLDSEEMLRRSKEFQAKLHNAGYAGITRPADCGGQGLGPEYLQIFNDDAHLYYKRAKSAELLFGSAGANRALLADRLGF